jgi:hypothetical protein
MEVAIRSKKLKMIHNRLTKKKRKEERNRRHSHGAPRKRRFNQSTNTTRSFYL